jgi:2-dehydro-3-deoxyglucarate aldolase
MNKLKAIKNIRNKLKQGEHSLGSWIQIPNASVAEIMSSSQFDWIAVDLEHGSISVESLPDLFRAIELGETLPLARLAQSDAKDCKQALDAGAGGIIIPMIESAKELKDIKKNSSWPPAGKRGVAFSRANLFGGLFKNYVEEAQSPLLVALIETKKGVKNIDEILDVEGLDAIMIGPYDLSASLGKTADFQSKEFLDALEKISNSANSKKIPYGIHIVEPSMTELEQRIKEGYKFLAYSMDSVMLRESANLEIFK